jgi:hypothetical protein
MTKTISQRVLHAATKEKSITTSVLRRRMRIPRTEMSNESFNNSIGRTVRLMAENGMLKRTDRGTYTITSKGRKAVNA